MLCGQDAGTRADYLRRPPTLIDLIQQETVKKVNVMNNESVRSFEHQSMETCAKRQEDTTHWLFLVVLRSAVTDETVTTLILAHTGGATSQLWRAQVSW